MIDPSAGEPLALAAPTMASQRPGPRAHVLYISVPIAGVDGVVRLRLDANGQVLSRQRIVPGAHATKRMPLSSAQEGKFFGTPLLGTPDPDQVIIGAPNATLAGGTGAVVVWNRHAPAQLITEPAVGLSPGGKNDDFGARMWLGTGAGAAEDRQGVDASLERRDRRAAVQR